MDTLQYDVLSLIELIETRPCLWDRTVDMYKDKSLKQMAWREICTFFQPDFDQLEPIQQKEIGECLITKWNNIRDAFVRSLRMKNGEQKKPYVYHNRLQFLYKVVKHDVSMTESPKVIRNYNSTDDRTLVARKRSCRYDLRPDLDDNPGTPGLVKIECDRELKPPSIDEDEAFFQSILSSVKSISEDDKIDFRMEVMALVKKYRLRNNSRSNSVQSDSSMLVRTADINNCVVYSTSLMQNDCSASASNG